MDSCRSRLPDSRGARLDEAAMTIEGNKECVVVGVDGSPESAMALAWAARYARAMGATIRAVLAWHDPAAADEELDKAITATLGDSPALEVERTIAYGHPSQVLIDQSRSADLLVVGSRGHGGFTGMLLGSVSTHCVTHAACPVTVVRTGTTG